MDTQVEVWPFGSGCHANKGDTLVVSLHGEEVMRKPIHRKHYYDRLVKFTDKQGRVTYEAGNKSTFGHLPLQET